MTINTTNKEGVIIETENIVSMFTIENELYIAHSGTVTTVAYSSAQVAEDMLQFITDHENNGTDLVAIDER